MRVAFHSHEDRAVGRAVARYVPELIRMAASGDSLPVELSSVAAQAQQYLEENVAFVLLQGLKALARERPENAADYLALYLLQRNPNTRDHTVEIPLRSLHAASGPSS